MQVKPEKDTEMSYLKLADFPEPVRLLIQMLPPRERTRLLYPHADPAQGRKIQETIIQVLEASIREGESEENLLNRLSDYANTNWP